MTSPRPSFPKNFDHKLNHSPPPMVTWIDCPMSEPVRAHLFDQSLTWLHANYARVGLSQFRVDADWSNCEIRFFQEPSRDLPTSFTRQSHCQIYWHPRDPALSLYFRTIHEVVHALRWTVASRQVSPDTTPFEVALLRTPRRTPPVGETRFMLRSTDLHSGFLAEHDLAHGLYVTLVSAKGETSDAPLCDLGDFLIVGQGPPRPDGTDSHEVTGWCLPGDIPRVGDGIREIPPLFQPEGPVEKFRFVDVVTRQLRHRCLTV